MNNFTLIIFDVDGTLADRETHQVYPRTREWFKAHGHKHKIAIATNQGGAGMRYWMQRDNFGQPALYPTEADARDHVQRVVEQLGVPVRTYICFAYQARSGRWSPTPDGKVGHPEWSPENRKPSPGMLIRAMADAGVQPSETLFVGNSIEDGQAAARAGVNYMRATNFFAVSEEETDAH